MKLYSTLDKKIVEIVPNKEGCISMYSCGPTVYSRMHIGNIRAYIDWDILYRSFIYTGYKMNRVMNITDVGHMTSNDDFGSDFGDDKMDKQAEKEGVQPIDIANKYIDTVLEDFKRLHILAPNGEIIPDNLTYEDVENYGWTRATTYVPQMIEFIKKIIANGYTYETDQAVYFDVTLLPDYNIFTGQKLEDKEVGVRDEVEEDKGKKHPADFVLWMKRVGKYANHIMNWDSPWGNGFPGWHIECSAMSTDRLGEYFDIHTGGVDHISVHHSNERAQNIGAYGHPVVKYWIHNEWLVTKDDAKLSKSKGASDLDEIISSGFTPMDLRYFFLSVNYRVKLQFSIEALEGAKNARKSLEDKIISLKEYKDGKVLESYKERFIENINNNLNMSGCLALVNELLKSTEKPEDILATLLDWDKVFGFGWEELLNTQTNEFIYCEGDNVELDTLIKERIEAKSNKDYAKADKIRNKITDLGYTITDTPDGVKVTKI
ncbi:cysteine--tRNA ligase [bacterium]|nr:cysteine--tRNA ligase [bacterium]